MLFASSGRNNFEELDMLPTLLEQAGEHDRACCTDVNVMLAALHADEAFRKSDLVQHLLTTSPEQTNPILTTCQQYACQQAGFQNIEVGLASLRSVAKRFKHHKKRDDLTQAAMWLRENRAQQCSFQAGQALQDTRLYKYSNTLTSEQQELTPIQLLETCQLAQQQKGTDGHVVLVAGSCT
jgi:hypothetical protein